MAQNTKVTERIFNAVKQLTAGGATIPECAEYFMLAHSTVSRIRASESYEDYKHTATVAYLKVKERNKKQEAKEAAEKVGAVPASTLVELPQTQVVEHKQTIQIQATHYMTEEMRKTNELLTCISKKLAFIVDELCGVKSDAQ